MVKIDEYVGFCVCHRSYLLWSSVIVYLESGLGQYVTYECLVGLLEHVSSNSCFEEGFELLRRGAHRG